MEVIASVMLLGIVAVFTLFFIISGVSGFVFSRQSTALSQKAGLALARITKELNSEMQTIKSTGAGSVEYVIEPVTDTRRHIALVGSGTRKKIKIVVGSGSLTPGESDEEVLIDQVSSFTLEFQKYDSSVPGWVNWNEGNPGDTMDNLGRINISLTLFINDYETETVSFTTTINPFSRHTMIGMLAPVFFSG